MLAPRKGHRLLLETLVGALDLDWTLACVGSAEPDPATVAQIRETSPCWGRVIESRWSVRWKTRCRLPARVSTWGRPGVVLRRLRDGARRGIGERTADRRGRGDRGHGAARGGLLVLPHDHAALGMGLPQVLGEPDMRRRLHEGALAARVELPRWMDIATAIEQRC
jgi:hypothetical protein